MLDMLCRGSRGTVIRDFIFDAWEKVLVARYVASRGRNMSEARKHRDGGEGDSERGQGVEPPEKRSHQLTILCGVSRA